MSRRQTRLRLISQPSHQFLLRCGLQRLLATNSCSRSVSRLRSATSAFSLEFSSRRCLNSRTSLTPIFRQFSTIYSPASPPASMRKLSAPSCIFFVSSAVLSYGRPSKTLDPSPVQSQGSRSSPSDTPRTQLPSPPPGYLALRLVTTPSSEEFKATTAAKEPGEVT